jgi:threonine/homoserine/homoserine lactone efflux protein
VPHPSTLFLFALAALALLLTPGPAVLYIVARSLSQGRWAGIVSGLGIALANLAHVAAAALGVSALLLSSALAFSALKYLGAAYLIYLGLRKLFARAAQNEAAQFQPQPLRQIFSQGFFVNLLNPKPALFFLAFLPQFIDAGRGSAVAQTLALGLVFILLAIVTDSLYALLAGSARQWLAGSRSFLRAERYVAGTVYIGLGVAAALSGGAKK